MEQGEINILFQYRRSTFISINGCHTKFQISGLFIYILHEKSYTMSTGEIDSQRNRLKIQFYILIQLELEIEIKECNRTYTGGKKYEEFGRRERS